MTTASQQKISVFAQPRPRILVVSHERSGTHFLMNSIAKAFGYVSAPFINFDLPQININYYSADAVCGYLRRFDNRNLANTVKSHHPVQFFGPTPDRVLDSFRICYIYRNPYHVMPSFWRYMHTWKWVEGPKTDTCGAFIRSQPCGKMMRYQMVQYPNMLKRWDAHVTDWLAAAQGRNAIMTVRYEELDRGYEDTVRRLGDWLGVKVRSPERPSDQTNIVKTTKQPSKGKAVWNADDLAFFDSEIGPTLQRLGYTHQGERPP